eukprot:s650_g7.t1
MVSCWRRVLARRRFKAAVHSVFVAKHLWRLGHSPRHPAVHLVHQLNQYCATPGCTHFRLMHIPMLCLQRGTDNAIPLGGSTSLGTRLFQLQHNAFEHLDTIGSLAAGPGACEAPDGGMEAADEFRGCTGCARILQANCAASMWQAISVWLLFCAEATSSDIGPRLLRQETPQHRFSHSRRHAMQVEGSGAIAPAGSGGLAEAIVRAVNVTNETEGEVSDVTLTARLGFKVPQCQVLLEKARNLLHFHASQLITEGRHHDTVRTLVVVFDALTALQGGNATEQSLEVIQAALGNVTLKTALQAGEVWTASDQGAFFYHCFPGLTPFQELEEHNYHGDIELDTYQEPTVTASHSSPVELHQDQHEVRYCYRIGTNTTAKRAFVAARKHISDQVPCLKFTHILPDIHGKGCSLSPAIEVRDQNSGCWAGYQKEWDGTNTGTIFLNLGRGTALCFAKKLGI